MKRKCFEVNSSYDKAKNIAKDLNIDEDDWEFCYNTARFFYTKENYKGIFKVLKSVFGEIRITTF